ncbi:MAG: ABC transporter permease [Proteobacteria bacterium]|nr:ABC transporter permease [Pseudomonadota bacterium]
MMKSFVWWLAFKQVFSRQKKAGLLFMTWASMIGITIGVGALVITLSVMGGFERELRHKIFFGLPHVEVMNKKASIGVSLTRYSLSEFAQAFDQFRALAAYIKADVIAHQDGQIASATILGIDPRKDHDVYGVRRSLLGFESLEELLASEVYDYPPVIVGSGLADTLQLHIGEIISLLSPQASLSGFLSGAKVSKEYKVVGYFRSGKNDYDESYVVTNLNEARQHMDDYDPSMDGDEFVTGVAVVFDDPDDVDRLRDNNRFLEQFSFLSWKDVNKALLFALLLEKLAMSVVLFLIVIVAIFSLSGTVMMTVYHKRTQISLLRGLGMTWHDVVKVFIAHGAIIGTIGIVLGLVVGLLTCVFILKVGVVTLPAGLYTLQKLPVKFLYFEYILISLCALLMTIIASVYPAYIAGRQDPGDGLRY